MTVNGMKLLQVVLQSCLMIWCGWVSTGNLSLGASAKVTQTLNAAVSANAKLSVPASVVVAAGQRFSGFSAIVPVSYRARTTAQGGGTITVRVSADFSPSGGPSAASGALVYKCSGATLGTGCSGTQTASIVSQTPVLVLPPSACTGGGAGCSSQDPNSVTVTFTLVDDPRYTTGTYSAALTFVISAM